MRQKTAYQRDVGFIALLAIACVAAGQRASAQVLPDFSAAVFSDSLNIDNPYFPLAPNKTYIYDVVNTDPATDEVTTELIRVEVLNETKTILGIEARVVRDRVWAEGLIVEDTYDWYAQDNAGNVWYLGEFVTDYLYDSLGNPIGTIHAGSWEVGVDGAKAGFIMEAIPQIGDHYYQEYYAGHAEDQGQVIGLGEMHTVPYGTFSNVLRTRDTSGTDPTSLAHKFFTPGVGTILEHDLDDEGEIIGVTTLRTIVPEPTSATMFAVLFATFLPRRRR